VSIDIEDDDSDAQMRRWIADPDTALDWSGEAIPNAAGDDPAAVYVAISQFKGIEVGGSVKDIDTFTFLQPQ
jgi:hypothetical protein